MNFFAFINILFVFSVPLSRTTFTSLLKSILTRIVCKLHDKYQKLFNSFRVLCKLTFETDPVYFIRPLFAAISSQTNVSRFRTPSSVIDANHPRNRFFYFRTASNQYANLRSTNVYCHVPATISVLFSIFLCITRKYIDMALIINISRIYSQIER